MATARISAGFNRIFYGVVDSNGYVIGSVAAGATAGAQAGSPMARLEGAVTFPVAIPEGVTVPVSGDDEPEVSFDFPSEELPNGVLGMSVRDLDFEALVQGTKVESIGDIHVGVRGPASASAVTMCLLLMRRSKKWASGVRGVSAWDIEFVPRCTIQPLGSNFEQRTHQPVNYKIVASKADRFPWGATYTEGLHGTTASVTVPIDSDNPLHIHPFLGNNSQQLFTLAYTPKSSSKIYVYEDGVKQALTTDYTVSGKDITFVGTPGSDSQIQVAYEVDEDDIG
jgi:hypothetical protein